MDGSWVALLVVNLVVCSVALKAVMKADTMDAYSVADSVVHSVVNWAALMDAMKAVVTVVCLVDSKDVMWAVALGSAWELSKELSLG